jgi:surface polysaccharide O-acyltransferase-like enzyme
LAFAPFSIGQARNLSSLATIFSFFFAGWICAKIMKPNQISATYLVGMFGCLLAWNIPGKMYRGIKNLAGKSLGIYVLHPLITSIITKGGLVINRPMLGITVFLISICMTAVLQRTPLKKFV